MLSDLAALTPPLVVGVAFVIGVVLFLRRQLGPAGRATGDRGGSEISGDHGGSGKAGQPDRPAPPSADQRKV